MNKDYKSFRSTTATPHVEYKLEHPELFNDEMLNGIVINYEQIISELKKEKEVLYDIIQYMIK